jgi:hypothetical protein
MVREIVNIQVWAYPIDAAIADKAPDQIGQVLHLHLLTRLLFCH